MASAAKISKMDEDSRFTRLPLEIIATILTNLDQPDLLSMMCVDKRFNEIIGRTAKLSKKLVLFFGNDWDTEDKKETLLKILKSGRTFTKLEIKMLNLNLVRNEPLILFIIDIIKKFNINFERISVKNSSFYLNEFIELLKAMPTITSISLYHNNIGDMSYGDNNSLKLEHLTELEILATGFNITNDNYKFICDAPQLTKLTSNINELSQLIANKPNLKELYLSEKSNFFTDAVQKSILFQLRKLSYRYTDGYDLINQRHNIKRFLEQQDNIIDLEYNALLINFQHIIEKRNIQKLSLKLYKIPDEDILLLSSKSVTHLILSFDQIKIKQSYNLINRFCKIFPNLRKLELGALNRLGDVLKNDLTLDGLTFLKEVEIWSLRQSMLKEVKIGQALAKVKIYPVGGDDAADLKDWKDFAINNPKILELELEDFPEHAIMVTIVVGMKHLEVLSFGSSECRAINIDEEILETIKTNCKHLRRLEVSMDLYDENTRIMISKKFQDKVQVVLSHCDFIIYEGTSDETATDPSTSSTESDDE